MPRRPLFYDDETTRESGPYYVSTTRYSWAKLFWDILIVPAFMGGIVGGIGYSIYWVFDWMGLNSNSLTFVKWVVIGVTGIVYFTYLTMGIGNFKDQTSETRITDTWSP